MFYIWGTNWKIIDFSYFYDYVLETLHTFNTDLLHYISTFPFLLPTVKTKKKRGSIIIQSPFGSVSIRKVNECKEK